MDGCVMHLFTLLHGYPIGLLLIRPSRRTVDRQDKKLSIHPSIELSIPAWLDI